MEDPIVHSHTEVPVVQVESRTQLENHEVISHDCDDRIHSTNVVENGASSHRAESITFIAKDNTYESKFDPLMKKSSTWNIFTSGHHQPQSATTKASSPGLETYDQSKLGAHDYIVHSDVSYQTYTHDLPRHSHALESPSKELDITELLKSVDEQIRRSTNHQAGDFAHHTTTTTTFGHEDYHSPVPMLNLHQSHVVEKSKKASHVAVEEPAHNSGRDLSPSSKSIFLGKTWAQDSIVQPVHSADTYLTSDVRNSLNLHNIETKKDYTYDVLHTPHLHNETFQSPALVDVHFSHSKNLFETPKKSFASPTNLYSDIHHSASKDYLQSESTAKLLADIKAEFLSPRINDTTTYVSHHHHHETPVRNLYQETAIGHLNIETPAHHHQPKDENESLVSTMKNMSGTISYIDDLISDLKHRHDKLNSRYSKTFGSEYDNHVHHTPSYTTGKAEEEKTKKAKAPQKPIQEKHHSQPKETHHSKQNDYASIKTLFAVLVVILLGVIFNQVLSISQDLMQ